MEAITVEVGGKTVIFDAEDLPLFQAHKWHLHSSGYALRYGGKDAAGRRQRIHFHREVLKAPVFAEVDHVNGNRQDNRKQNLRFCHHFQNTQNRCPITGTSKYKGVGWHKGAWRVRIQLLDKRFDIGRFDTELAAAQAYDYVARMLFREFARLNDPTVRVQPVGSWTHSDDYWPTLRRENIA